MTLQEMFDQGIVFQGIIKIQKWESDCEPTVLFEGNADDCLFNDYDEDVDYVFPYMYNNYEAAMCFELAN